ncbi:LuxR C-terminal-related transcriptional regulator [Streptomyces sp. NPDC002920]
MEEALALFERAVAVDSTADDGAVAVFVLFQLALTRTHLGDPRAAETGRRAIALAEAHGERWGRAHALWALGYGAWVRGDREESMELIRAGLEIERGFNDCLGTVLMLELFAWLTATDGGYERAGRLLGAVRGLWRDIGNSITAFGPLMAEDHTRCEESVVYALGPVAYERALADGGGHNSPGLAIDYALSTGTEPAAPSPLTRREREVAALVAEGMTNRRIAAELTLSPRTVDSHIENILAKLGFGSRTRIAAWWTANQPPTP